MERPNLNPKKIRFLLPCKEARRIREEKERESGKQSSNIIESSTTVTTTTLKRKASEPTLWETVQNENRERKIQRLETKVGKMEKQMTQMAKTIGLLQEQMAQWGGSGGEEKRDGASESCEDDLDEDPDMDEVRRQEGGDYVPTSDAEDTDIILDSN